MRYRVVVISRPPSGGDFESTEDFKADDVRISEGALLLAKIYEGDDELRLLKTFARGYWKSVEPIDG